MNVSLVIPAYNEEHRLAETLTYYGDVLRRAFGDSFELLVVANGCTDTTVQVAEQLAATIPYIRIITIEAPVGKGGAILEGFHHAHGQRILFVDADASTSADSLLELIELLDHSNIAIGSRRLSGSVILQQQPLSRRVAGFTFATCVRLLFHLPYRDTQCGAKAFQRSAAKRLAQVVTECRWAFDVDLLLMAQALELTVTEHAVTWRDRSGSKLRISRTLAEVLQSLWRLKRRDVQRVVLSPMYTLREVDA